MILHFDVFSLKNESKVKKQVYLTTIYRCNQGMKDILSIADIFLPQFKLGNPPIKDLNVKSDNNGCYYGALVPEALNKDFKTCKFHLKGYAYDEPCKGKGQCDRESAGEIAKKINKKLC